jgi:hypothetical protein
MAASPCPVRSLRSEHSSGVNIVAGPFVNREHMTVVIAETDRAEGLDDFLVDSRLAQWNQVHILPSRSLEEGLTEIQEGTSLF